MSNTGASLKKTQGQPFLIRRQSGPTPEPANWPWGRFAIGLEFDKGQLFYGIRFDETVGHFSHPVSVPMPTSAAAELALQLGTSSRSWQYWPGGTGPMF